MVPKWSQNGPECVFAHFWTKNTKITDLKILKKNKQNNFFKNLRFFAHIKLYEDVVNQIPCPSYNQKFKKVRAHIFFVLFFLEIYGFGHFLVRFLVYLVQCSAKP